MTETVSTERAWCECYKRNAIADECDNCDGQFSASRTQEPADMAGGELTFTEAGEHGNCVISPEGSSEAYFTLIGGGDDQAQNALAAQICRAVNSITPPAPERKEDELRALLDLALRELDALDAKTVPAQIRNALAALSKPGEQFECPINQPGCTKDCGSYGCGN